MLGRAKGRPCRGQEDGPADRDQPLCGLLRFTPGAGHAGTRRIYAVSDNGASSRRTGRRAIPARGGLAICVFGAAARR